MLLNAKRGKMNTDPKDDGTQCREGPIAGRPSHPLNYPRSHHKVQNHSKSRCEFAVGLSRMR